MKKNYITLTAQEKYNEWVFECLSYAEPYFYMETDGYEVQA